MKPKPDIGSTMAGSEAEPVTVRISVLINSINPRVVLRYCQCWQSSAL